MKKLIGILLTMALLLSVLTLAGCGKKEEKVTSLKLGYGAVSYLDQAKSATDEAAGSVTASTTFAAVLLDADGKIVKCAIDAIDCKLSFSAKGEYIPENSYATKYELGDSYGMVAYGGATKEWFEQADAFEKVVVGKTLAEVKKLVATDGKGSDEVVKAGCTITVTDFVAALEKAINNAKDSKAGAKDSLNIGVVATGSGKKAETEAAGNAAVDISVSAVAKNSDGKVTAIVTDAISASVAFDVKGNPAVSEKTTLASKRELGKDYGMVAYGGATKEWYEQANAFDKKCIGKTASGIAALATAEGKGTDDVVKAGCTITITDMVKSAEKAAK